MAILKEFKEFAVKGNAMDMAVGIIIGGAFGGVVSSLVKDVIMPPIGMALGNVDFKDIFMVLREGATPGPYLSLAQAQEAGAITMNIGVFVNSVISFLIVAFAVFILVKNLNRLRRPPAPAPKPPVKICPYCFTEIPEKALRCPACTSTLEK
ncbi:MAG: large-conductance mechanosensitive channel protein MscL [Aminobacterium sp.]|jgi:large conductance mechanosensitive channel|nr:MULTISPECIES: large-conductance mechanosensitive channel protein MscL [unclassified Aminobacterium]MDD2206877.1 large-conductance mechanosensitive channel protein MscL [Aminobacterium sp.]MDD3425423.1 large-conductance mechanosensitive channel protein MscL [Aminobacterium sp.]MDD3707901.1 large-conductance mechanosensitive channel protein MscL [Aminobacterium sp.]MDD4229450.1 large-conductance mechanosensitive channel protein MscL [Aminobacterium sp.]MDD4551002.1 large-conductance mechanose